jgi:hypothetical protein
MAEMPWSKFFWSDWESDQGLRLCSLAAQGLWMRMLCVCAKGDPIGYLAINGKPLDSTGVARLCGISAEEAESLMEELDLNGVFSRDRRGWIYNRRMMKDAKKSATGKKYAKKRWKQDTDNKGKKSEPNGSPNGPPTTQKPEARSQIKIDDDDDAGERLSDLVPDKPDKLDPPGWRRLDREALLTAMGADPVSGLVGPNGRQIGGLADMHTAGAWLDDLGLTEGEVMAIIAEVMAKKHDGPPSSFRYFNAAMATFAGRKGEPKLSPTKPPERKPGAYQSPGRQASNSWDEDPFIKRMKQKYNVGQTPQEAAE